MSQENVYQFGPFCLDANERVLLRDGRLIPLAPKALNTLLVLVRNRGHVVEKDALMAEVWPDEIVEEGNLTQHVHMLRRALGETTGVPQYIETIPRRGYRFLGVVTETHGEPAVLPSPTQLPEPINSAKSPFPYLVAVLPFTNASGNEKVEHLSDGVTESLINSLSRLPQLRVTARSTVFRYKTELTDPVTIGRELGVQVVLVGRLGVWQKKVTIGAELLDVSTGGQLWGETYYSDTEGILEVQDKIVKEISVAFQLRLSGGQERELIRRHTDSSAAYQNYLKGRFHWNKRSEYGLKRSIAYLNEAISVDPQYALAHAGLADSYNLLGFYCMLSPHDAFPKAKASASRALALDPMSAEANASLGFAQMLYDWDWHAAEQSFKQAIQLNPHYVTAYLFYGCHLVAAGRFEEASNAYERALQLDPLSLIANAGQGYGAYFARRYEEAIKHCKRTIEMDDQFEVAHVWLGWSYERMGMFKEALAEYERGITLSSSPASIIASMGSAFALSGKSEEARNILSDLMKIATQKYVSPYGIACIYVALGQIDTAFDWLERAYLDRSHLLVNLKVDPRIDSLRSDPRLANLIRRLVPINRSTKNGEAVENYVSGRACWRLHTRDGLEQAAKYFQRSIELDSNYVPAYSALVDCYLRLATNYLLGPDLGESQPPTPSSVALREEWDRASAELERERAADLNSHYPAPHQWHAACLLSNELCRKALTRTWRNGLQRPQPADESTLFETTDLTPAEEVQILCLITRDQIEVGNIEAGRLLLQKWYTIGEWPMLDGLTPQSSADLLFTAGRLVGRFANTRALPQGQKHAQSLLNGAISLFEQLGLKTHAAETKAEVGRCYHREGRFELARTSFLMALNEMSPDDWELRARTLVAFAFAEMKVGHLRDSLARLNEASNIVASAGPFAVHALPVEMATTLGELAIAERSDEYFTQACEYYRQSLALSEGVGHHRRIAVLENNHGYLLLAFNKLDEAEFHLRRARTLFDHFSDPRPELDETLARLHLTLGRYDLAEDAIGRSVALLESAEEDAVLAESLRTQGRVFFKLGRERKARRILDRAYQLAARCGDLEGAGLAMLILMEEMGARLQEDECQEIASILQRLLGNSQSPSVLERLQKLQLGPFDSNSKAANDVG